MTNAQKLNRQKCNACIKTYVMDGERTSTKSAFCDLQNFSNAKRAFVDDTRIIKSYAMVE